MKFLNTSTKQDNTNKINLHPWRGIEKEWKPFLSWGEKKENPNWHSLEWYQIYNKSKHERYGYFDKVTLEVLLNSICALLILLTSQFIDDSIISNDDNLIFTKNNQYKTAIGKYFTIKFPDNIPENDRYDFDWKELSKTETPIKTFDYNNVT